MTNLPRRRWFQFGIGTMLAMTAIVAIVITFGRWFGRVSIIPVESVIDIGEVSNGDIGSVAVSVLNKGTSPIAVDLHSYSMRGIALEDKPNVVSVQPGKTHDFQVSWKVMHDERPGNFNRWINFKTSDRNQPMIRFDLVGKLVPSHP